MTTVSIHMPEQSGQAGLSLYLRKTSDGTLINTGGDALIESPASSGRFAADVAESWDETLAAAVVNGSSLTVRDGWLASGSVIVVDAYPKVDLVDDPNPTAVAAIQNGLATSLALATVGANVTTLLSRVTTTVATLWANLTAMISGSSGTAAFTETALANAPVGGGGGGTGARTITVTVNDGSTALQNAKVRLTEGVNTFIASTNASGVATLNVDDATYTVAITKAGYTYAGTTLVVDGDETPTYSMTAVTVTPPSDEDKIRGTALVYDEDEQLEVNVPVYFAKYSGPGTAGYIHDAATKTLMSNANGEISGEFSKGWTYSIWRGEGTVKRRFTVPTSGTSFSIAEYLGEDV